MSATGSFIWYELMTSDATAAAKFYGAVVGWKIADRSDPPGGDMDYRMINRGDGGYNGGVLSLTSDMVQHGARPAWLGYLHVADVDAAVKMAADCSCRARICPSAPLRWSPTRWARPST
jgi:predicted enzyme related to lactoylglutathione lyase